MKIRSAAQIVNDDWKVPMKSPLDQVERRLRQTVQGLATMVSEKPGRSLAIAFVVGIGLAKLLRKLR